MPGGSATLTFDLDELTGGDEVVTVVDPIPLPSLTPPFQLDESYPHNGGVAAAKGSVFHIDGNPFGIQYPGQTGVSQSDPSGEAFLDAASLTLTFSGTWTMDEQFGPTAYGYANSPNIVGNVAAGLGSFVRFELDADFTGAATRSHVHYDTGEITTAGAVFRSFFDKEELDPNYLPQGETETISGTLKFTARGIGSESYIPLEEASGVVPEPQTAGLAAGVALALWAGLRRRRSAACAQRRVHAAKRTR